MKKHQKGKVERVELKKSVYEKMMDFATQGIPLEVIGVLFGEYKQEEEKVIVNYCENIREGLRTTVDFEDEDYERLYQLNKKYASLDQLLVGWYHSHPFNGKRDYLYLSSRDKYYHHLHQREAPFFIAIVLNPFHKDKQGHGLKIFQLKDVEKKILKTRTIPFKIVEE